MPCCFSAAMSLGLSLLANNPPCTFGGKVFTRPSIISGKPVTCSMRTTGTPSRRNASAGPPVETICHLKSTNARAKATSPRLAETESSALDADLLPDTEDKDDGMFELRAIEPAQRENQRGAAHPIIEAPAGGARTREPHVLLRHGDRLPDSHAQGFRARARRRADTHAHRRRGVARQPCVARQENRRDITAITVDQRRLRFEERADESAACAQRQRPIGQNRVNPKADLVHVRDDDDGLATALANAHPQIAGGVGLCFRPTREQTL